MPAKRLANFQELRKGIGRKLPKSAESDRLKGSPETADVLLRLQAMALHQRATRPVAFLGDPGDPIAAFSKRVSEEGVDERVGCT